MNPVLAASLFDSPWLILAIMAATAIANWLAKHREKKRDGGELQPAGPPPRDPKGFEEQLREFLGQEPPPTVSPPPLVEASEPEQEWVRSAREEIMAARRHRAAPATETPPAPVATEDETSAGSAVRRFAELSNKAGHPATAVVLRPRQAHRQAWSTYWRNPRNARQAFAASLVFGPPKGLEN